MKIFYLPRFKREYKKLPLRVRELAIEKEKIFRNDFSDPRLNTHKLHGPLKTFWAFWVDYKYRIIFDFLDKDTARFYSIGDHDIYE